MSADLAESADLAGLTACPTDGGAVWFNLATDPRNCGACDRRCCIATVCVNGQCVGDCNPGSQMCPAPMPDCIGGFYCADLTSDPNNCGACKQTCAPGQICATGVCR